jgi:hypothetical protein
VPGEPDEVVRDSGRGTEDVVVEDVGRGTGSARLVAGGASGTTGVVAEGVEGKARTGVAVERGGGFSMGSGPATSGTEALPGVAATCDCTHEPKMGNGKQVGDSSALVLKYVTPRVTENLN